VKQGIRPPEVPRQKVLVDFSSPNIAKEMHVGHLRSTILGESFSRLMEFVGHEVHRINHVGDWGTQFGMLIHFLKLQHPDFLQNPPEISDLVAFYKSAKKCFDEDATFKEQARLEVVKLQAYDPESIKAWNIFCDTSRKEFKDIYDRLGIKVEERGESFYNPLIPEVLRLLEEAGQIEESDGAKVVISRESKGVAALTKSDMAKLGSGHLITCKRDGSFTVHPNLIAVMRELKVLEGDEGSERVQLSKKESKPWAKFDPRTDTEKLFAMLEPAFKNGLHPLLREVFASQRALNGELIMVPRFSFPLIVQKSDGAYTYDTTDVAAMYHRFVLEKMDRVVYFTDVGQFEHFKMCAQVAEDMGWLKNATWSHGGFGLVSGEDGKKLKTRSGDTVKLKDLLDEAVDRSMAILREREQSDRKQGHTDVEMVELSHKIGYGAVKYFDLKQNRTTDYSFSFDKMLDMNGNTAVFLMYQYARICSIKRKAGVADEELASFNEVVIESPKEKKLALCAFKFTSVVLKTCEDVYPHHLADFVYELVNSFSEFFQECRVIGHPLQNSRLLLCELAGATIKKTLELLGIEAPERI
jgi:arginyl-tRNA synthetase